MGRPARYTFIPFGQNVNAAADICEFGTPATGTPVYTNVITTLMALAAWATGWAAETIANNRPFLEDMNAVCYVFGYFLNYILVLGIPEYDPGTTYYLYSVCQYNGIAYQVNNDNAGAGVIGVLPTNTANWKLFSQVTGILGTPVTRNQTTIYQAATDGYLIGNGPTTGGAELAISIGAINPPNNEIAYVQGGVQGGLQSYGTVETLVPKGYYYEAGVAGTSFTQLYWIPIGS